MNNKNELGRSQKRRRNNITVLRDDEPCYNEKEEHALTRQTHIDRNVLVFLSFFYPPIPYTRTSCITLSSHSKHIPFTAHDDDDEDERAK